MNTEKTPDQLRAEMYQKLMQQGNAQHLTEIAMPGVIQPVARDTDEE